MAAVIQRPLRGSRISTFYPVKNLPSLSSLDSAFQLQEYISLLIRYDVHDVDRIVTPPGPSKDKVKEDNVASSKDAEVTVDTSCWIYEQLRRLAQDLSHPLITTLQQECTRASCPEMKAGEWLYLCVAHGNDGAMEQCCAIDYILHTVDSATALLNSPRTFPSRLQIPQTSHRHFASLARRLGRIFAHAYFHHREAFEQAEAESSLYARFLALTSKFDLVPSEFLVIPSSHFSGEDNSDEDVPRNYSEGTRHYPPQLREEDHRRFEQSQREATASSVPPAPVVSSSSSGSRDSATKTRITRPRTDTMIFTDAEASAMTEELASRRLEHDDEEEPPSTARPSLSSEEEAQFEAVPIPEAKTREADPVVPPVAGPGQEVEPEGKQEATEPEPKEEPIPSTTEAEITQVSTNPAQTEAEADNNTANLSSEGCSSAAVPGEEAAEVEKSETQPTASHILEIIPVSNDEMPAEETFLSEAIKAGAELDAVIASLSAEDIEAHIPPPDQQPEHTSESVEERSSDVSGEELLAQEQLVEKEKEVEPVNNTLSVEQESSKEAPAEL